MLRMHLALCKMYGQITTGFGKWTSEMAGVDFWSSMMSTAKLWGNVWHASHLNVHPPFGLKILSWILTHGFRRLFKQNVCRITVNLILPSPLVWERPSNYSFGEVAHLEWHLHLRAYDVWLSGTISKTSCHLAIIEWRPQKVVERWPREGQLCQKNASVSEDCGKNQYWTWLTAPRHPNCYWICCKHLQTFLHSQKGRKKPHHSFIRFSKLSCTMQVLIFSKIPLRSGNGPNWPIECDKLCTSWHS